MTTEEKAKAYDEALKQIKECTPDENGFITIYPQEIFRELTESEDERIKRCISDAVRKYGVEFATGTITKEKMLAWLEKQGDKDKPTYSTYSKDVQLTQEEYDKRRVSDEATIKEVEAYKKGLEDAQKIFEKQGEQKPIEWSDEDSQMVTCLIITLQYAIETSLNDNFIKQIKEQKEWLKSLKDRVHLQPKQEWNEEDENIRKKIIKFLKEQNYFDGKVDEFKEPYKKEYEWLKSLKDRVQPKQEWSEEDMKMIGTLVAIFKVNYPDGFYKVNPIGTTNMQGIHSSEIIKWLKSLKNKVQLKVE